MVNWRQLRSKPLQTEPKTLTAMRFRPPRSPLPAEARWALLRAFGPAGRPWNGPLDPERAIEMARALDLAPRIATRVAIPCLVAELGEERARRLTAARGVAAVSSTELIETARLLALTAAEAGIPIVLLKGIALQARGFVSIGARWMSDVDVLVAEPAVEPLADALRASGFETLAGTVACEHQMPPLRRAGQTLEIHRFLPGVVPPGETSFATTETLLRQQALEPLFGWPKGTRVPSPHVLAAHALVHGIAQHGFAPRSYPLTRMLADLADLGAGAVAAAFSWAAPHVSAEEARAVSELLLELAAGALPEASPLLAHAVFGLTDARYAASLRFRALGSGPSLLPRPLAFARDVWQALFPGRARLVGLYGLEGSDLTRAARRPLDLAFRLGRMLWS
jgi:hypothetical protein